MILITGATGKIGGAVIKQLLTELPPSQIAALSRSADKAAGLAAQGISVRTGDYGDPASLEAAMQGVEKVLLVSGGGAADGLQQHKNVVDAARKTGVKCIAYTGRALQDRDTLANGLMIRHFETEDYIKESGLSYILFRNILYMDVLPIYTGPRVLEDGIFRWPAGDGAVSFALRREMGEAIANVLAKDDCSNKTYTFTGSQTYSFNDVAKELSELSGKQVNFAPMPAEDFAAWMKGNNQPPFLIKLTTDFATDIAAGQESTVSGELEEKLGRKPTGLREGLKELFHL